MGSLGSGGSVKARSDRPDELGGHGVGVDGEDDSASGRLDVSSSASSIVEEGDVVG